jgi:hypothetical protein
MNQLGAHASLALPQIGLRLLPRGHRPLEVVEIRLMRMAYAASFTLIVTWLAGVSVLAQDEKATPAGGKFPTEGHKQLDRLVGTWDVAISFKVGPGKMSEGTSACVAKWILDGKALQQEYSSKFNGRPLTVMQWLGYDANKKKFFELKLDSMDTGVMHNEGVLSDDGKTLTQLGERVDPQTGKMTKIRTVTTFFDNDHYLLEWYLPGEDGKEEKSVILKHARKK